MRPHLKMSGTSYRIDETYVRGMRCKDYFRARKSVECLSLSGNPEQRNDEERLPSRVTPG
jgi:hypothetical protein